MTVRSRSAGPRGRLAPRSQSETRHSRTLRWRAKKSAWKDARARARRGSPWERGVDQRQASVSDFAHGLLVDGADLGGDLVQALVVGEQAVNGLDLIQAHQSFECAGQTFALECQCAPEIADSESTGYRDELERFKTAINLTEDANRLLSCKPRRALPRASAFSARHPFPSCRSGGHRSTPAGSVAPRQSPRWHRTG